MKNYNGREDNDDDDDHNAYKSVDNWNNVY